MRSQKEREFNVVERDNGDNGIFSSVAWTMKPGQV
jgi:hypothetical protein